MLMLLKIGSLNRACVDTCPQATLAKLISALKCSSIGKELVTAINVSEFIS